MTAGSADSSLYRRGRREDRLSPDPTPFQEIGMNIRLQAAITLIRGRKIEQPLQYLNFRD